MPIQQISLFLSQGNILKFGWIRLALFVFIMGNSLGCSCQRLDFADGEVQQINFLLNLYRGFTQ